LLTAFSFLQEVKIKTIRNGSILFIDFYSVFDNYCQLVYMSDNGRLIHPKSGRFV